MTPSSDHHPDAITRARAALTSLFVADALAMPVHWYYNPADIEAAFPGGITGFKDAPAHHPSSIMSLHSTRQGGRTSVEKSRSTPEVVGEVILKGKADFWNRDNIHYHQGMKAGENTLNAHCARVLMRSVIENQGRYDSDRFLDDYIAFMTADPPRHNDTYAESYHRGFFANLTTGRAKDRCGARTHDTPSVGGLVTIGPLAIALRLAGITLEDTQATCRQHLFLTHPDDSLAEIVDGYVALIDSLLFRDAEQDPQSLFAQAAQQTVGVDLPALARSVTEDREVLGGRYSTACYISDSWPSLLYLAYKYWNRPKEAMLANTNCGGENCHRGAVLGGLVSLACGRTVDEWVSDLVDGPAIVLEIDDLIGAV